ncbi:MAG: T9SS type A sorting domain-containing protein [Chitinophagaceae bacterium]|nr:T9SS type A sorting domain-containing protein [Chitinophagaceae bacterium]
MSTKHRLPLHGQSLHLTTTATSVTLTGLTASTAYNWRVTTNCSASASTAVSANFTTLAATGCQSSLDNATNGTISGAAVIPFNTNVTGLISPSGDNDYYKFVITTGGTATVTLTTLPADYDLTIVNSAGTQLAISQNGSTTSETITRTYTAGTYYARVFGYNNANNASVCYTLKVQLGTASLTGTNTPEITQNGLLKIYPNQVTDFVTVSVLGNVDKQSVINVVDVNGRVVMTSKMINNLQRVDVSSLPKGVYMLQVNTATGKLSSKFVKQ